MINFKALELLVNSSYSFVGIEKRDNVLCFCLPKGFSNKLPELDTYLIKRDLFFLFYKVLKTFKEICLEKGYLETTSEFGARKRDGIIRSIYGSEIQTNEDSLGNIFYAKLDDIGQLLDAYDEPKILSLAHRLGNSESFDVSQIHRYLHQAVYLDNHAAYVDQMVLPQRVVQFESADIVTMYCYLFCEVKQQLEETVNAEITALAERFRQHYLESQDSLFDEQSYEQTLSILKDVLETIDHNTSIKDFDYWQYYEAIEIFLYGDWHQAEDGEIWGIKDFYSVWESICLTYLAQTVDPSLLLHLDTRYVSSQTLKGTEPSTEIVEVSKLFQINNSQLNPDAVILTSVTSQIKEQKSYRIGANSDWNDYGYKTIITGLGVKALRVGYINQSYDHTLEKIKELYQSDEWGRVVIDKPLPNNFYSFWEIPENLDLECLHTMKYFNHFFYLALERRITNWNKFYEEFLLSLGVLFGLHYNDPRVNVFTQSLFRDSSSRDVKRKFDNFIEQVFSQHQDFFEIIDIKYLTSDYFRDSNKIEDIKRRSVRKQFVYEYLLQKGLEHGNKQFSDLSIYSSFWLPSYRPDDSNLLDSESTFMDGYIQLKNVNFKVLIEHYLI